MKNIRDGKTSYKLIRCGWIGLFLFFIIYANKTYSERHAEVKGIVMCGITGSPLEYATVSLMMLPDSVNADNTLTNDRGMFSFTEMGPGSYFIVIQYMGYRTKTIPDLIIADGRKHIDLGNIGMEVTVQDIPEVTVSTEKNAVAYQIDKKVISVTKELAAEGGTAVDALQNAPSVQVDAYGNVLLRGSSDFTLLINGRPTLMEASQVLQQTLAETIESIEIITNPSVKYEASGTTGIINIKLKSQKDNMAEGILNLSLANGDKYSGNIMLNKQFKKFRVFAGFSYSNKTQRTENWGYHQVFDTLGAYRDSIFSNRKIKRVSAKLKMGADYNISDNNSLSFSAELGKWQFFRDISSHFMLNTEEVPDSSFMQYNTEAFSLINNYFSGDISYTHLFKNKEGHKLDLVAFYGGLRNKTNDDFRIEEPDHLQEISNISDRSQWRFNADYTLPLNHGLSFETGLFADLQGSMYEYRVNEETGLKDSTGRNETEFNDFDYQSNVLAGYASLSGSVKTWFSFQAGIRVENYNYSFFEKRDGEKYASNMTNLFPSVHLSKEVGQRHRFGLSYSRRINRPDEWQLCPFVYSSDTYETRRGNPGLKQSLIDSYELSYLLMTGKFRMNTDIFHRWSHAPIGSYLLEESGQFVMTYENLDHEANTGVDLMGIYTPLDWLQFRVSVSAYQMQWKGTLSDGNELQGSSMQGNGSFISTFTIKKNTSLQFMAIYYAPGDIPQGHADAFYYFDFIVKHSFFKKTLTLGLRTHNTFDSGLYHYTAAGSNYYSEGWYRYEGPVVIFNLTYKLNNFKPLAVDPGVKMDFDSGLDH